AEPGDEVAARVADGGAAELPDEGDDVHAEPVLVGGRMPGLVEAGVHAAAEVLDERAEGAAPDRGDDGLPVELDVDAGQCGSFRGARGFAAGGRRSAACPCRGAWQGQARNGPVAGPVRGPVRGSALHGTGESADDALLEDREEDQR